MNTLPSFYLQGGTLGHIKFGSLVEFLLSGDFLFYFESLAPGVWVTLSFAGVFSITSDRSRPP